MRLIQDIGDLTLVGFLFTPYGWIALLLAGMFFMAVREEMSTEKGKKKWQGYSQFVRGKKRIALVSVAAIIALALTSQFMTSGSHGQCSKDGKYPTDEEFIKAALRNDPVALFKLDPSKIVQYADQIPQLAENYLAHNPDCCKVFRKRESEVSELSWSYWRDGVVVRVRTEKSLKEFGSGTKGLTGTGYVLDDGIGYVYVGNCGGVTSIPELTPGG
jgi:hypothetical protein